MSELFINALVSFFVVIDPISAALIFHGLTGLETARHKRQLAIKTSIISFLILCAFCFWGNTLLQKLGISIESFKIAGGLLLFHSAFSMIISSDNANFLPRKTGTDISVFPMSIPMIAGPGTLTLCILLFAKADHNHQDQLILLSALVTVSLITLICFFLAGHIKKIIGKTGDDILQRLMGVLLAAYAIQFIIDGITSIIKQNS